MQKPPKISVIIINFNGQRFLRNLFESIFAQTTAPNGIIFIDNASHDDSVEWVEKHYGDVGKRYGEAGKSHRKARDHSREAQKYHEKNVIIIKNKENLGFAKAANMGIQASKDADFISLLNPDVILAPTFLANGLKPFTQDTKIAATTGKILLYDFEKNLPTKKIDTVGIFCFRNRRFIDQGQGQNDEGQFQKSQEVFGVSGACPIYRKSALEDAKVFGEYFDAQFFMYKEDVDLSWRLRLFGWKCWYESTAVAYHGRGTKILQKFSHTEVLKNRSKLSYEQKYYAYKNQRLMQTKNESLQGFFTDFFPIITKEILIFAFLLFREPRLFKALAHFFYQIPLAFKKRRYILKKSRVKWPELQRWFTKNSPK